MSDREIVQISDDTIEMRYLYDRVQYRYEKETKLIVSRYLRRDDNWSDWHGFSMISPQSHPKLYDALMKLQGR